MGKHLCSIYFSMCANVCVCVCAACACVCARTRLLHVCVLLLPVLEKDSEKVLVSHGRHHNDEVNENGRRACVCVRVMVCIITCES